MFSIRSFDSSNPNLWDEYINSHPKGTLYHLSGWKKIIEKTYGHKAYYLMAVKDAQKSIAPRNFYPGEIFEKYSSPCEILHRQFNRGEGDLAGVANSVVGVLPLVHLKHILFGNRLISIPFFDMGGMLAEAVEVEKELLKQSIELAKKLKVDHIEIRSNQQIAYLESSRKAESISNWKVYTFSHKVRMLLRLPESSEVLMKSFKSKLRSQVKKPIKKGLKVKIGGFELIGDFYKVFSINMRDLGSPVHTKRLMQNVLEKLSDKVRIFMVYKETEPVACSLVVGFKDTLENPWASALRKYSGLAPNMLLYWSMLEYACDNGFKYFDFGRSSIDEGTYKFKRQWGARPEPLYWYDIALDGKPITTAISEQSSFELAAQVWKKLPVTVTRVIGPMIRKYIGL